MEVAASPEAGATDWVGVASFFAALGRWREETAFVLEGLERYPGDEGLHQALHRAATTAGGPVAAVELAKEVALAHDTSATAWWYVGYELVALGDWLRRGERPGEAIEAYGKAQGALARSLELDPSFADTAQHYVALASLGRGFAHLLAGRQQEAADELVLALQRRKAIAEVRDGLDREAIDLLDGVLEERAAGRSPVDPNTLMMRLEATDYGSDTWSRAMADSWLREALRAEGRGDELGFDEYITRSVLCARRALELDNGEANKHLLAQSATVLAESMIARLDAPRARHALRIAAPLLGENPPVTQDLYDLSDLAARLRGMLGDPRPIARPGR
jgi:tetratricopeptide (TPR) repeat protein